MGFFRNLGKKFEDMDRARDEIDDGRTTNRFLRSLRRHDRVLDEEEEVEFLRKKIKMREMKKSNLLSKAKMEKPVLMKSLLKEKQFMIERKRPRRSMFGKGSL